MSDYLEACEPHVKAISHIVANHTQEDRDEIAQDLRIFLAQLDYFPGTGDEFADLWHGRHAICNAEARRVTEAQYE